jgi:hypothetical protein
MRKKDQTMNKSHYTTALDTQPVTRAETYFTAAQWIEEQDFWLRASIYRPYIQLAGVGNVPAVLAPIWGLVQTSDGTIFALSANYFITSLQLAHDTPIYLLAETDPRPGFEFSGLFFMATLRYGPERGQRIELRISIKHALETCWLAWAKIGCSGYNMEPVEAVDMARAMMDAAQLSQGLTLAFQRVVEYEMHIWQAAQDAIKGA